MQTQIFFPVFPLDRRLTHFKNFVQDPRFIYYFLVVFFQVDRGNFGSSNYDNQDESDVIFEPLDEEDYNLDNHDYGQDADDYGGGGIVRTGDDDYICTIQPDVSL